MADNNIFDNSLTGTQRLIQATAGILTFSNSPTDNSFSIGPGDSDDYYRLTVSRSSNVIVKLYPDGGNLNLAVLDATGNPVPGLATNNPSALTDVVVTDAASPLQAGGTYYIRVSGNSTTEINYTLSVETTPVTRADILWRNISPLGSPESGVNGIWRMNGTTLVSAEVIGSPVDPVWRLAAAADFDGDGVEDYFWQETNTGGLGIWLMDGTGTVIKSVAGIPFIVPGEWYIAGVGDFGGDSSLDIVWRNSNTGFTGVWIMNGTSFAAIAEIDYLDNPAWVIEDVADYNGDSKPDFFYRNLVTGQNVLWMMNGTQFESAVSLPTVALDWRMEGSGDVDGDGDADFFWRNYASGENGVWFMNRTEFIQPASTSFVDPSWTIAGILKKVPPIDIAGNAIGSAFYIGKLDNTATYQDTIGPADTQDFYAFNLAIGSKVGVTARGIGLSAATEIDILAADGSTIVGSTTANGANEERLSNLILNPGNYFVRVRSFSSTNIRYTIDIAAEEQLPVNLLFPTTPPITTFKNLNGSTFTSATAVSVVNPFTFDLEYKVTYTGRPLNEFKVGFFLSKNGILDASDLRLDLNNDGQGNANDFALITGAQPNTEITRTQRLTLPSKDSPFWIDEGLYNIIIVLDPDNEILEQNQTGNPAENDNTFAAQIRVRDARRPDLIPQNFDVTQSTVSRGSIVNLTGAVRNIGTAASDTLLQAGAPFPVSFYLSTDQQFSRNDRFLRTIQISTLAAGAQTSIGSAVTVTIPTNISPGQYFILMVIDPDRNLEELTGGELNNVAFDTITIT